MEEKANRFVYVDFASSSSRLRKFRNNIVHIEKIKEMLERCNYSDCFTTYFRFDREIFDHIKRNNNSVSGYDGEAFSDFLPFDIDHHDLKRAQETTKKLAERLMEWGVSRKAFVVFFSGSKGFHLLLSRRAFADIKPSKNLHVIFAAMRSMIAKEAELDMETVDLSISDKLRLFRLPNSIHSSTGLWKIELTMKELFNLTPDQIKEIAENPRQTFYTDSYGLLATEAYVNQSEKLNSIYKKALKRLLDYADKCIKSSELKEAHENYGDKDIEKIFCRAERKIWQNNVPEGSRNNCAVRLLSKLRIKGSTQASSEELIMNWNVSNNIFLSDGELQSIVRSVYSRPYAYDFGCNDEILKCYCPYKDRSDCKDYRVYKIKTITK